MAATQGQFCVKTILDDYFRKLARNAPHTWCIVSTATPPDFWSTPKPLRSRADSRTQLEPHRHRSPLRGFSVGRNAPKGGRSRKLAQRQQSLYHLFFADRQRRKVCAHALSDIASQPLLLTRRAKTRHRPQKSNPRPPSRSRLPRLWRHQIRKRRRSHRPSVSTRPSASTSITPSRANRCTSKRRFPRLSQKCLPKARRSPKPPKKGPDF